MTIALPSSPLPQSATIAPVLFGGPLLAGLGGEDQWLNRLGSRWQLEVQTPRLKPEPDGSVWTNALGRAWFTGERVSFPVPQPGLVVGAPGSPVVDGGGQTGSVLNIRGLSPGYSVPARAFLNVITGGRRYLYRIYQRLADDQVAGTAVLAISPMLRVSPANGDTIELVAPLIEGLLVGDQRSWTQVIARTQGLRFTIRETR